MKKLVEEGRVWDGLYYLKPKREGKVLVVNNKVSAGLWHRRLGHLPIS